MNENLDTCYGVWLVVPLWFEKLFDKWERTNRTKVLVRIARKRRSAK